ncbi:MAG: transcriptional repressor [Desulfobacteraceae bacterium]|nr:transcriptional repressor [Pseudomonadota bacterium]MBU4259367.1 transcriptional repressor [Pseudomonadota bacterium]MBU4414996.1 transcriptional repressor [Pseudomonadota bacterium]MCG2758491.1 transcriptional repressor [Desulfobacteraceae bacterium]
MILDILEGNTTHPSANDIHKTVVTKYPTTSFSTVYNTLEMLTNVGELDKICILGNVIKYEPNTDPHAHLLCKKCNRIIDIFEPYYAKPSIRKIKQFPHTIEKVQEFLYCTCASCLKGRQGKKLA